MGDHAETFQIDFDPAVLSYEQLLERFWNSHDPRRRGSMQYRAALFPSGETQQKLAAESRQRVMASLARPLGTMIEPNASYFNAEDYHQKYYLRHDRELFAAFANYTPEAFRESTVAARLNALIATGNIPSNFENELPHYGLTSSQLQKVQTLVGRGRVVCG